jgi:hypothetical protein
MIYFFGPNGSVFFFFLVQYAEKGLKKKKKTREGYILFGIAL